MAAGEQWEGSGREEGGHSAVKRRRHGRALPAVTGADVPPHRGDVQAAGATEHNRAVGPERADKSAVPPQAAFAKAQGQAAQTVAQPTAQQHQPPPTAAQALASTPEAPGVKAIPMAPGPSPGASPEESWRLEMLDAINQMQLMVSLLQTSLSRMARTVEWGPHGP